VASSKLFDSLIDNMISTGETLNSALDGLRQQVETATRKTTEN
jgi:hypothetical protein